MFGLFHKKAKKVEGVPRKKAPQDEYEVYRMMRPEEIELESRAKLEQARHLAIQWNGMTAKERSENADIYFQFWNLRKEAQFLRELKSNPDTRSPELFKPMSPQAVDKIHPFVWDSKYNK